MSNPTCIGIIMDGNRRWANKHNLPSHKGHEAGLEALITLLRDRADLQKEGIEHLIFYTFSTENWNRSEKEVSYLLTLFEKGFARIEKELKEISNPPRIRFIGDTKRFSASLQAYMKKLEEETKENEGTVAFAVSYGGRDEIIRAAKRMSDAGDTNLTQYLDTHDIPDPEIIIRTGGEKRLSNFLLWQGAYSELFFLDTLWPEITTGDIVEVCQAYKMRERRLGI